MKEKATTPIKNQAYNPIDKNAKGIENHRKAAMHLEMAAKSHLEAANYQEAGDHAKAAQSTITAHGHVSLARKTQKADLEQHATTC